MKTIINSTQQLKKFLDMLHEAPQAPVAASTPASSEQPAEEPTTPQTPEQQGVSISNVSNEPASKNVKQTKITLAMITDKLNSIRSGHSLKDANILQQMQQYFNSLNSVERLALYAFLKGIAQVVTSEAAEEVAAEPSATPAPAETQPAPTPAGQPQATKTEAPKPQQALPTAQVAQPPVAAGKKVRTIKPTIVRKAPPMPTPIVPKSR